MFSRSGNEERPVGILSDVWVCRNQRWRPITGSRNDITCISACIQDGNEFSMAVLKFSGSASNKTIGYTVETARTCGVVWNIRYGARALHSSRTCRVVNDIHFKSVADIRYRYWLWLKKYRRNRYTNAKLRRNGN